MAENDTAPENQKTSLLAESLFSGAAQRRVMDHIQGARKDIKRGAIEQATEHLKRAEEPLRQFWYNEVSENLTDEENREWMDLRNKIDAMDEDGYFISTFPTPEEQERYDHLTKKAYGDLDEKSK